MLRVDHGYCRAYMLMALAERAVRGNKWRLGLERTIYSTTVGNEAQAMPLANDTRNCRLMFSDVRACLSRGT